MSNGEQELEIAESFLADAFDQAQSISQIGDVEQRRAYTESIHAGPMKQAFKEIDKAAKKGADVREIKGLAYKQAGNIDFFCVAGGGADEFSEQLLMSGFLQGAEKKYRQALELIPDDGGAHLNLGKALWGRERKLEAMKEFERARDLAEAQGDEDLKLDALKEISRLESSTKSVTLGNTKVDVMAMLKGSVVLIVGVFLIPILIGIPIVIAGGFMIYRGFAVKQS